MGIAECLPGDAPGSVTPVVDLFGQPRTRVSRIAPPASQR